MPSVHRQQRWLTWKNIDTSDEPVCPPYGHVEIVGYEYVGRNLVLKGRSATCFALTYDEVQGPNFRHGFNNHLGVDPGELGLMTFDMPTWSAVVPSALIQFGSFLSMGIYLDVDLVTINELGAPWKLGYAEGLRDYSNHQNTGYNNYRYESENERAFVGGIETVVKDANRFF